MSALSFSYDDTDQESERDKLKLKKTWDELLSGPQEPDRKKARGYIPLALASKVLESVEETQIDDV